MPVQFHFQMEELEFQAIGKHPRGEECPYQRQEQASDSQCSQLGLALFSHPSEL